MAPIQVLTNNLLYDFSQVPIPANTVVSALGFAPLPGLYWPILLLTLLGYMGLAQITKEWLLRKKWIRAWISKSCSLASHSRLVSVC